MVGTSLSPSPDEVRSLGARLEELRRLHRAERLELVLTALHDRCVAAATGGAEPPALRAAIESFRIELAALGAEERTR